MWFYFCLSGIRCDSLYFVPQLFRGFMRVEHKPFEVTTKKTEINSESDNQKTEDPERCFLLFTT